MAKIEERNEMSANNNVNREERGAKPLEEIVDDSTRRARVLPD